MALGITCNQCKRVLNNALFYIGKYQQSGKYIMTSSNSLAKVIETLERNPYYSKYTEKIAALQKEAPDKLVSRWENYQRDTKNVPVQPSETRQMSSLSKPKAEIGSSSCVGISKHRALNDIMKVEMIKDKTKEEIEKIWLEYFKNQDGIAAIISKETYEIIQRKSSVYPVFIFPLPRSQGYEFFMCQFSGNEAHFTSLINYQAFKENAPECLTIVHYPEIIDEKKIVLMNGEFDKNVLDSSEALCLVNQMQLYYGMDDKKRDKHLERFTNSPEDFKHMDLIAELECLSL